MEFAARIAPEIDRLVLAVNRAAGDTVRDEVATASAALGLDSPASLPHYAEFLLAGALTEELVFLRLPYLPPAGLASRLEGWRRVGVVTGPPGAMVASPGLAPVLRRILDARAREAASLWGVASSFDPAAELTTEVVERIPERFTLAVAHRALPDPDDRFLRLHHRLTTLRYVRSRCHVEAWRAHGLTAEAITAMTALWRGDPAETGPGLERLVEAGLAVEDGTGLSVAGTRLRQAIEADTNRATEPVFRVLDEDGREDLLAALAQLPGSPG